MSSSGNNATSQEDSTNSKSSYNPTSTPATSIPSSSIRSSSPTLSNPKGTPPGSPPPYGESFGSIEDDDSNVGATASVASDGRVNVRIDQHTKGLQSFLVPALRSTLDLSKTSAPTPYVPPTLTGLGKSDPPPLNVVIHVVGSRGDVQPFVALGKVLKDRYNHRVRLATHPTFKDFVEENGLEFFNIAGDPSELMAFMVKNPGLMPGFESLRRGDVGRRRKEIRSMINGCWRSCIEPGDGMDFANNVTDLSDYAALGLPDEANPPPRPFVADAIIANPPSFAHIHCAEKLGIPLHMMFTMPWSPTSQFPHPLANIQSSNADTNLTNFMSYALVDMMTWQGLGDVINRFRQKVLGLEPINLTWAPGMLARLKIPYTYCWSPALIPKPADWGPHITLSGFYFLPLANNFVPDPELAEFLQSGPPPVYIGFGSIVVDDPNAMTKLIFDTVRKTGQRALVSKGWGGFGADQIGIPDGVYMLGNVPHDWLFQHVSCVVHHGGAGTTAAGITAGKPTVIVPFFGDQPFWGSMVARAGAGPQPIPYKQLTADKLAASITEALKPEVLAKAEEMRAKISREKGTEAGASYFHKELNVDKLRCHLAPHRPAVWRIRRTEVRLSALAAATLGEERLLKFSDLKLYRPRDYNTDDDPWDPISGGASALLGTMGAMAMGVADLPISALKALKIHPDAQRIKTPPRSRATSTTTPSRPRTPRLSLSRPRSSKEDPSTDKAEPSSAGYGGPGSRHLRPHGDSLSAVISPPASPARSASPAAQEPAAAAAIAGQMAGAGAVDRVISRPDSPSERKRRSRSASGVQFDLESAIETGKGGFKVVSAGLKSPMDFTLAIAKGFHNAPRLYGDETVRKPEKITDFASGLKAAGKEFAYGMGDGLSGLVTHPLEGAKKEGAAGFIKGFGRGVGGLILKPGAAFWGIPGYTSKGIYMELQKAFGPSVESYVIAARTAQGFDDMIKSTPEERAAIIEGWKEVRKFLRKRKNPGEEQLEGLQKRMHEKMSRVRAYSNAICPPGQDVVGNLQRSRTVDTIESGFYSPEESEVVENPLSRSHTFNQERQGSPFEPELEEAIARSIAETSTGNAQEDAQVEQAVRASVLEIKNLRHEGADDDEVRRAIEASIEDANRGLRHDSHSKQHEQDLALAISASLKDHAETDEERRRAEREEEIVMQYVMRQSEAEASWKQKSEAKERPA